MARHDALTDLPNRVLCASGWSMKAQARQARRDAGGA